jgi:hypothetical protein
MRADEPSPSGDKNAHRQLATAGSGSSTGHWRIPAVEKLK